MSTKSRRVQILMTPAEQEALERVAAEEHTSVAELIRIAVRDRWLNRKKSPAELRAETDVLCHLNLPLGDWSEIKADMLAHRYEEHDGIP